MKPIAIFRHVACEGPGYLHNILDRYDLEHELIAIDAGHGVPSDPGSYSALIFLGGPMSANDQLNWISQELALIRIAHRRNMPILGHCLGAQLIAKALGALVRRNAIREIGWFPVFSVECSEQAFSIDGLSPSFYAFHWHGETFEIPKQARHLWHSHACANQGFAIGNTLALQFHAEITPELVDWWAAEYDKSISTPEPTVQSNADMKSATSLHISALHEAADTIYAHWLKPLIRDG